jgi:hypothetical protein
MANTTINNVSVIRGSIHMELQGTWIADLVIDQVDGTGFSAGTSVTIQTANISLVGTVIPGRTGDVFDAVHVRVAGGAGGLGATASAQNFIQPGAFVRDVVNALCSDGGETLSATADATFLATNLAAWSIKTGTVAQGLLALLALKAPTFSCRILTDGTLWMGTETWPASSGTADILAQDPTENSFDLGVESPWIVPGVNVSGVGNVNKVTHYIEQTKIRSHVLVDIPGEERGMRADIAGIVAQEMANVDFYGRYECKVIAQSADLSTVDLQPVNAKFAGLQRVPLRLGLPGVTAQFAPGAKVLLGWMEGDPSQPYAGLFYGGETLTALTVGTAADNVITKQDITTLMAAISAATYIPYPLGVAGPATPIAFVVPTITGSLTLKAQR